MQEREKLTVDLRKKSLRERVAFLKELLAARSKLHHCGIAVRIKVKKTSSNK